MSTCEFKGQQNSRKEALRRDEEILTQTPELVFSAQQYRNQASVAGSQTASQSLEPYLPHSMMYRYIIYNIVYMYMYMSWVQILFEAAHFSLEE